MPAPSTYIRRQKGASDVRLEPSVISIRSMFNKFESWFTDIVNPADEVTLQNGSTLNSKPAGTVYATTGKIPQAGTYEITLFTTVGATGADVRLELLDRASNIIIAFQVHSNTVNHGPAIFPSTRMFLDTGWELRVRQTGASAVDISAFISWRRISKNKTPTIGDVLKSQGAFGGLLAQISPTVTRPSAVHQPTPTGIVQPSSQPVNNSPGNNYSVGGSD